MIFIVSGEGASDIGVCTNGMGECKNNDFKPGAMTVLIDKIVGTIINYSILDAGAVECVPKSALSLRCKKLPMTLLAGKKRGYETAYFFKNARVLGQIAIKRKNSENCPVGAVLFCDADGTRSTECGLYESKRKSIIDGFRAADFEHGVAMVPKPKSEAWLICAMKSQPYQHCDNLENNLSGNDNHPNSAKTQLTQMLANSGKTVDDISEMIEKGDICFSQIDMPSYNAFRGDLEDVTRNMIA